MDALNLIPLGATLSQRGLTAQASGSLSYADATTLIVTGRGHRLDALTVSTLIPLYHEGRKQARGLTAPTPAWKFHMAAHRGRPTEPFAALISPPRTLTLSLLGVPLPALIPEHYLVFGAAIPCIESAELGSDGYFDTLSDALRLAPAALLQNLGLLVMGATVNEVLHRAKGIEAASTLYLEALAVGDPTPLPASALDWFDSVDWWDNQLG